MERRGGIGVGVRGVWLGVARGAWCGGVARDGSGAWCMVRDAWGWVGWGAWGGAHLAREKLDHLADGHARGEAVRVHDDVGADAEVGEGQ
eukprot:3809554-Prymnesium_polylepis.1